MNPSSPSREEDHEELLTLSLSIGSQPSPTPFTVDPPVPEVPPSFEPLYSLPPPVYLISVENSTDGSFSPNPNIPRRERRRSTATKILSNGKSETIPAPYPWATTQRATVHNLDFLLSNGLNLIRGEVQCKKCEKKYEMEYVLAEKFAEVAAFLSANRSTMHNRGPEVWMNPSLPDCKLCKQSNCVKPVLTKKRSINWLFLLLGQMLGCCKLSELKYFCKHTRNHRTGAKDRVLYLTYLGLCKQLDPTGPFDVD